MNQNQMGSYLFIAIVVTFGGFIFGLDVALISGTLDFIKAEFGLSEIEKGLAASASAWGALAALPLTSFTSERFGRKKSLIMVASFYFVSAVCSAISMSFLTLSMARFLGGLAFSSLSLASMYIGETSPAHLRGKLVSLNQINIAVGLLAAYIINYFILQCANSGSAFSVAFGFDIYTWRWMLGVEIIPALIWVLLLLCIPESPRWLIYKSRVTEAKSILMRIVPDFGESVNREEEINRRADLIQESVRNEGVARSSLSQVKELFTPRLRKILFLGLSIALAQQITGINAITYYAPSLFEQLGIGRDSAFVSSIFVGAASLVATLLSLAFIDRVGRRPIAVCGMAAMVLCLGICTYGFKTANYSITNDAIVQMAPVVKNAEALRSIEGKVYNNDVEFKDSVKELIGENEAYKHASLILQKATQINSWLILLGVILFVAAYNFSMGPVMWVLLSEIVPTSLRSGVIPFFALVTALVSAFAQNLFPWQIDVWGAGNTFLMFFSFGAIGLILIYKNVVETKNKTIEEIEKELITEDK